MMLIEETKANLLAHNAFAYTGQPIGVKNQLFMLGGYRQYDARLGRFLKQDTYSPFRDGRLSNGYSYAAGNPLAFMDPSGHVIMLISKIVLRSGLSLLSPSNMVLRQMDELKSKLNVKPKRYVYAFELNDVNSPVSLEPYSIGQRIWVHKARKVLHAIDHAAREEMLKRNSDAVCPICREVQLRQYEKGVYVGEESNFQFLRRIENDVAFMG